MPDHYETDISVHPYAKLFPRMGNDDFEELKRDILIHGVRQPIVMFNHLILDGRHRFDACFQLGINCPQVDFEGDDEAALAYVLSTNLHRRHLNESQRAVVAARLANMRRGDNQHTAIAGTSQQRAAAMLNVSADSVGRARAVIDRGAPELVAMVEQGEVAVSAAAQVAKLPSARQKSIVAMGAAEVARTASVRRASQEVQTEQKHTPLVRKVLALWAKATSEERRLILNEINAPEPRQEQWLPKVLAMWAEGSEEDRRRFMAAIMEDA